MKKIKIKAVGSAQWIGGLYYKRNVLFSLLQNPYICSNYKITVATSKEVGAYFTMLRDQIKVVEYSQNEKIRKIQEVFGDLAEHSDYEFPACENLARKMLGIRPIKWIPDFQHNYYPEYFTKEELEQRSAEYRDVQQSESPLVLSSNTCLKDFEKFYGKKKNVYVVPFVSYLEPELKLLTNQKEQEILDKYDLNGVSYACINNQFWKHKNHIVVLEAIKKLKLKPGEFRFIFTGMPKDYRNPEYYQALLKLLEDSDVKPHITVLGFIDRIDQIGIMKHAEFVIQPSLFEGWGTVVEDAKVLNKRILLSDIPLHREQMNGDCILFEPHSSENLAELICQSRTEKHQDNLEKGLKDMHYRAKEYSKGFEQMLRDMEKEKK